MVLKEAKEILENIDVIDLKETHDVTDETYNTAIETILQELDRLQKENEILESCKYVDSLEIIRAKREECERWRGKIREKIKEIYEDENSEYYDMFLEQRDIEKTISILKDLLKEE